MRNRNIAVGALALALVTAACGDESSPPPGAISTPHTDPTTSTTAGTSTSQAPTTPTDEISAADGTLSDGVWQVGEAGTVEFTLDDGGLTLVEAKANEGWRMSIDEESSDEIEVDFERDNLDYQIEIEHRDGVLEIEIDLDIDPADPDSFAVGPGGDVTISVTGDNVVLDDLTVSDEWTVVEQDTDDGEVEVTLRRDDVKWEFKAEIDDGRLDVEIDFEIEGRLP